MKNKTPFLLIHTAFLTALFSLFSGSLFGQLVITSVIATPSTCPNNGTISVQATTTNPPLTYSLTSGPSPQPTQTGTTFNSLPPGNYTVFISDGAGNHQSQNVVITGSYQTIDFTPIRTTPSCPTSSDGEITGALAAGTGVAPFTWQLISPSPVTTPPQSSNTFENLPAGSYTMRVADACNNLRTVNVVLAAPNTSMQVYGGLTAEKTGCDEMLIRYRILVNELRMPFSFQYITSNGTFVPVSGTTIDTSFVQSDGLVMIEQIIPGLTYGDCIQAIVTNSCGDQLTSEPLCTHPFVFYPRYVFGQCGNEVSLFLEINPATEGYDTFLNHPITYTLTNTSTNVVHSSGTDSNPGNTSVGVAIPTLVISGETYHFSITDGCGDVFEQDYTIPGQAPPQIIASQPVYNACIDSVLGSYSVLTNGFGLNARLIVLSGPSELGSTTPGFEYSGTYTYPDTISGIDYFLMSNLALGTYTYKIIDDCGNELSDSFDIIPQMITHLQRYSGYKKGCLGQNSLHFAIFTAGNVTVTDLSDNTVIHDQDYADYSGLFSYDSVMNVAAGSYAVTFSYYNSLTNPLNDSPIPCAVVTDTIVIGEYEFPEVYAGNTLMCNNAVYLELIPDTTKGVAPYEYEIIGGPQTFTLQASNVFLVTQPGIYTVRILDHCGNASAMQVFVDSITFPPPSAITSCNNARIIFPSSEFYTYHWTAPDNSTFTGDSLVLAPVTAADTGIYEIVRIVSINGCTDTLSISYHVGMGNYNAQTIPFCEGSEVTVGMSIYDQPGIYSDTLISLVGGCDSVIVTTLVLIPRLSDTTQTSICLGDSLQIAGTWYSAEGFYVDSVQNASGCYDLLTTELTILGIPDTLDRTICHGYGFDIGPNHYTFTGTYTDTLASSLGCDSIIVLNLTVRPENHQLLAETICEGASFTVGGNAYTDPGIYTDTLLSATACDSIITLTLTVLPNPQSTISEIVCFGQQYTLNGITYAQTGTYIQTFPTPGCDSIVTLHLIVLPQLSVTISVNAYETINGTFAQLNGNASTQPVDYYWTGNAIYSDSSIKNPTTIIDSATWIYLIVTDANGCTAVAELLVEIPVVSSLYIPNSVTPNGDEFNQIFRVYGTNLEEFELLIFDRWGEIIFESNEVELGWDVTYKRKIVQDSIYTYKVKARGMDGVFYDQTGHITVLQ